MREFDIDEILLEANYKHPKGYIDLSLYEDILFLENIMYDMHYDSDIITEIKTVLSEGRPSAHPEWTYTWRAAGKEALERLHIPYKADAQFVTTDKLKLPALLIKKSTVIPIDKSELSQYKNGNYSFRTDVEGGVTLIIPASKDFDQSMITRQKLRGDIEATDYESVICIAYNMKFSKVKILDAMKLAKINPKNYDKFIDIFDKNKNIINSFKENFKSMGRTLEKTSKDKDIPSDTKWRGNDNTPKADIFGGVKNRISIKKMGGSQLMSPGKEETISIFNAAKEYYSTLDKKNSVVPIAKIIKQIDTTFKIYPKMGGHIDDYMKKIKNDYTAYRKSQLTDSGDIEKYGQAAIDKHINAEFLSMKNNVDKSDDIIPTIKKPVNFNSFIKDFNQNSDVESTLKTTMVELFHKSIEHGMVRETIETAFHDKDFKKWVIYEAATGVYKFTGKANYAENTILKPIANKILMFDEDGTMHEADITEKWCYTYADKVNVIVSFKAAGFNTSAYSAFRLSTPKSVKEVHPIDSIIDGEIQNFNENMNSLNTLDESITDIYEYIKNIYSKLIDFIKDLYENTIKKIIEQIKEWAKQGLEFFLEMLGIDVEGEAFADVKF